MKKNVWIMNHYAGGMFFDHGGRHYNFAKYLKQAGYEPVVFCCNAKHGKAEQFYDTESLWHEHMAEEIETPFVFVKARTYAGNGKQRVLNMADFYRNVQKAAKEYARAHGKPDIIYASSVHPLTLVAGIRLAKYFGVECICEVRDLWPESIVEYSSRFTKKNPVIKLLYQGEKWIYKKADKLIFTREGDRDYLVEQGWDTAHGGPINLRKVYYINNGVDLEAFADNRRHFQVQDADLNDLEIFKVVYTGSIRHVNGLGLLLDVAKEVKDPRIKFLIWGDGDELPALQQRLLDEHIENVVFKGRVDKRYIPDIVSRADLNLNHNTPVSLFKYGISFNKLFDYLAAGKPVLSDFPARYNPSVQWEAGQDVEEPTPTEIARAIACFAAMEPAEYACYCANAGRAAQVFDFKALTQTLIAVIEGTISGDEQIWRYQKNCSRQRSPSNVTL